MNKPTILTGLRANNDLHLGNYLGALLPIVKMQKEYGKDYQINLFVPDLHSFTTPVDHSKLYYQTMHNLKLYVAAGLDLTQKNTYLYRQSFITAHSELTIILNCFTYMGELSRMTQFKEKSGERDNISAGLFDYPVLMTADILLYGAKYVPVGDDQTQHVELARDIALRVNNKFNKDIFDPPEPEKEQLAFTGRQQRLRIRDLLVPNKKMSKSDPNSKGVIFLGDTPDAAAKKIINATTDSIGKIDYDYNKQPGVSNLLDILAALSQTSTQSVTAYYKGQSQYKNLKNDVADAVYKFIKDFQTKMSAVNEADMKQKLQVSESIMNQIANEKLKQVQSVVGLRP